MRSHWRKIVALVCLAGMAVPLFAITGGPGEIKCPVCGHKNTFYVWYSWGSYIYMYPSRFQLIFWPFTDPASLYSCRKCYFTAFSGDFENAPKEKFEITREVLKSVAKAPPEPTPVTGTTREEREYEKKMPYRRIPIVDRLEIAEKIFSALGKEDNERCHFYRVKGYLLDKAGKKEEAAAARRKALEIATGIAVDASRGGEHKEMLVITAAMKHYLKDDTGALEDLRAAAKLTFAHPKLKPENNKNYDEYLSKLIRDYVSAIEGGKSTDGDDHSE